jgi:hypothetical protein
MLRREYFNRNMLQVTLIHYINISYKTMINLHQNLHAEHTHSKNYTREVARYKLELVCVQELRWVKGETVRSGN